MKKISLIGACALSLAAGQLAADQSPAPQISGGKNFPYRAWSIAITSGDRALEEQYVEAACAHAREDKINTLEFHDYVMPGGIVDQLVHYTAFPELSRLPSLTHKGISVTQAERDRDLIRFRRMAAEAHEHGMKVNVWYHVFRDFPEELVRMYPQAGNLDSNFIWEFIDASVTEFFQRVPEADRITLTSLHETPSVLAHTGGPSPEERLLKLYQVIYQACHRAGKELIIRDFMVNADDTKMFRSVINRMPSDVYVMTKDVFADWAHLDLPLNPVMHWYIDRKLIVEFDLYGEWSGRGDLPTCYPEYISRHLRECKAMNAVGAVGRLIHDSRPASELPFRTIFDAPQGVNVYAFCHSLSEPMPWLGETAATWTDNLQAIDRRYWAQWARQRYGAQAMVPVVRALARTTQIEKYTFDLAGLGFRLYIWYPTFEREKLGASWSKAFSWRNFVDRLDRGVDISFLRDEKSQARSMTKASLQDIQEAKPNLSGVDYVLLDQLFHNTLLIIDAYDGALEGYYAVYEHQARPVPARLAAAASRLRDFADRIDRVRPANWYFGLTGQMRRLADEVAAGKALAIE